MEVGSRGADSHSGQSGNLAVTVALHVVEHEHFSSAVREPANGALQIQSSRVVVPAGLFGNRGLLREGLDLLSSRPSSAVAEDDVDGQPVQPGRECAPALERAEPFPGADEAHLGELFCQRRAATHAQAQGVDPADVVVVEAFERASVTADGASNQLGVGRVGRLRR